MPIKTKKRYSITKIQFYTYVDVKAKCVTFIGVQLRHVTNRELKGLTL